MKLDEGLARLVCRAEENLGHLEIKLAAQAKEMLQQAAEAGAQNKTDPSAAFGCSG